MKRVKASLIISFVLNLIETSDSINEAILTADLRSDSSSKFSELSSALVSGSRRLTFKNLTIKSPEARNSTSSVFSDLLVFRLKIC
jgi:hypothetical protein